MSTFFTSRVALPVVLSACLALSAAAGCTPSTSNGGGSSGASGASGGTNGTGSAEPGLVGIWQETVASNDSGYAARLKVRANGAFVFEYFLSGATAACATASSLDKAVGTVDFTRDRLVLRPTQRTVERRDCDGQETRTLPNDPMEFSASVKSYETLIGETTLQVELVGGGLGQPLKLTLLQLEPPADPAQPAAPPSFQLGNAPPYTELLGLWAPSPSSDVKFYEPSNGEFYVPKYNGAEHRWIRFEGGRYELATVFESANDVGTCKKDLVYYETGNALFNLVRRENDRNFGDVRFEAESARMIVQIRQCEEDDGVKAYDLKPLTSYYAFEYTPSVGFLLGCEYPKHAYQFPVCVNRVGWNTFRKR